MDTLFFIASKTLGWAVKPESWIVLGLAWAWIALLRKRTRRARRITGVTLLMTLAIAILPLNSLALRPLETAFPVNPPLVNIDGIIVLGGPEDISGTDAWNQVQLYGGAERLTASLMLARQFPDVPLVYSGGSGKLRDIGSDLQGQTVAERFYAEQGLDPDRLISDRASRNTAENATNTAALVNPAQRWVLVTSAFHMPRAMQSFTRAGFTDLVPYPVDYLSDPSGGSIGWNLAWNLDDLNTALKEYAGLLVYRLTGR